MSIRPFTVVSGAAPYLPRANIDTDVIIRIERLTSLPKEQLGPYAMEALRYRADGSDDPDFILNRLTFRGAPILLAGDNFGCGSSREGAVWALQGIGVRCVVAPSFGDIFYSNCFQNGVLPIRLPAPEVEALAAACADGAPLTVDLERRMLIAPSGAHVWGYLSGNGLLTAVTLGWIAGLAAAAAWCESGAARESPDQP